MITMFSLFAEIERDLISERTKEGLARARAEGKLLGRPPGPGKSKLDPYKEEIIALLKTGSTKAYLAKKYGVTPPTLYNWLNKRQIKVELDL
jgi:DNA invertase Pin-like site-specific DNA recombinase